MVDDHLRLPGLRTVCIREVLKSLKESAKLLIEDKITALGVGNRFDVQSSRIIGPGNGLIMFEGMQDHTAETIKSLEGFDRAWVEEAQSLSERSLSLLRPTIRKEGSEIWFSWNPTRKKDAVDNFLRALNPDSSIVVEANWRDNPWFPRVLEDERQRDLKLYPERYDHIWEGGYAKAFEGAYFAKLLGECKSTGRIGDVTADPLLPLRACFDLGGSGAQADAMSIWIVQWTGQKILVLDYIEGVGQVLAYYVDELRRRGYQRALCILPHDGINANAITGKKYKDHLEDAEFEVQVIENQGKGAAAMRIEATRRILPKCWFNEKTTESGRDALGFYHERKDETRQVGLGPEHDWCLAAGTRVLTSTGWRNVEEIRVHDEVLTPCGVRRVLRSGIVRMTNKWTTVRGICCTPEHRFFTSRGLVEAGALALRERLWTRDILGLRILGFLCATFSLGLKTAITSATPKGKPRSAAQCSFIAWCMRLFMAKYRKDMKSIISMMTHSITIPTILRHCLASNIAASTNQRLDISVFAECVDANLVATTLSDRDAARSASESTMREPSASDEPAYNLTIDVDECYFIRGEDGLAYLVSNSSHCADAFGLMAVAYEEPSRGQAFNRKLNYVNVASA